jgi:hypothetical protein
MNFPKTKNPIETNSINCEWCGSETNSFFNNDNLKTPSSSTSIKPLIILLSWLLMFMGVVVKLIAFYRIQIIRNYSSNDLYYVTLLFPLGLSIKITNKYEK